MDDEGLECKPDIILYAFELAGPYATGKSNSAKLTNRQELALSLVDWAWAECDRGIRILELTNRVSELESQLADARKGQGGSIIVGPIP